MYAVYHNCWASPSSSATHRVPGNALKQRDGGSQSVQKFGPGKFSLVIHLDFIKQSESDFLLTEAHCIKLQRVRFLQMFPELVCSRERENLKVPSPQPEALAFSLITQGIHFLEPWLSNDCEVST